MKKIQFYVLFLMVTGILFQSVIHAEVVPNKSKTTELRAPAYPLITIDPYTSVWSATDKLFDGPTRHWTGKICPLIGAIRVDGTVYRFLGKEDLPKKVIVPMAKEEAWEGKYTNTLPAKGWELQKFDDASWTKAKAAFGTPGTSFTTTSWKTSDIWVRREFTIPAVLPGGEIYIVYSHDDDFELFLNGKQLINTGPSAKSDVVLAIDSKLLIKGGKNIIAAHCHDSGGLSYVDFGVYADANPVKVFSKTAVQDKVSLSATQTHYDFTCGPVSLKLEFVSPLLPSDLDLLSRPVNYINYEVASLDGKNHDVQLYFEATPQWAVNDVAQEVKVKKGETGHIGFAKAGTIEQPILKKKGDDLRIDWGYFYLAAGKDAKSVVTIGDYISCKEAFIKSGVLAKGADSLTAKMSTSMPVMACVNKLGSVASKPVNGFIMIGYDDVESIQYFGDNLKGWWTKGGTVTMNDVLQKASTDHDSVMQRCIRFDNKLWEETTTAGGKSYADLCILAFRQSIAAHKLVKDTKGNILFLSKENFSNGSIGTVDVTYPSAPLFLKYNPELLKGMLNPIFYFSESGKWVKPFPSHDVGTYPLANGQTYGGDMPVEEGGNMLVLTTAIAKAEGNALYAKEHWDVLTIWADYLLQNGLNPENQLCTDDFAGHFAHNTNLSVKAIMGIAGYGKLAAMLGKTDIAEKYTAQAREMAIKWVDMANDGDHFRLTFDQPGTWSQKYNLVWDKLLDLNIFPKGVAGKEIAFYLTKQNKYGLPLDNRRTYTKSDWIVWTATLADDLDNFKKLIEPVHAFVTETPDRVPMSDWFETTNATQVGFQARSVVGGYFIKLLETPAKH
jgi:hypothetical protein